MTQVLPSSSVSGGRRTRQKKPSNLDLSTRRPKPCAHDCATPLYIRRPAQSEVPQSPLAIGMVGATKLAVAAACVAGVAGFAPAGTVGNLRLRGATAESRLNLGGPRLRAAPSKIVMAEAVDTRRYCNRTLWREHTSRECACWALLVAALSLTSTVWSHSGEAWKNCMRFSRSYPA